MTQDSITDSFGQYLADKIDAVVSGPMEDNGFTPNIGKIATYIRRYYLNETVRVAENNADGLEAVVQRLLGAVTLETETMVHKPASGAVCALLKKGRRALFTDGGQELIGMALYEQTHRPAIGGEAYDCVREVKWLKKNKLVVPTTPILNFYREAVSVYERYFQCTAKVCSVPFWQGMDLPPLSEAERKIKRLELSEDERRERLGHYKEGYDTLSTLRNDLRMLEESATENK